MELTGVNGVEQISPLLRLVDVGVDQERVSFGMNVLHHDLKSVKATSLRNLNFATESFDEILIHDPI